MKPLITFLILFCYTTDITAQRIIIVQNNSYQQQNPYQQHNSYQQVSTITAYEQSIPSDFLFLVDDDIQSVIFNPARAASLPNSFVNTSIRGGNNTKFTSAGLVPVNSGKWFYSVGGVVNTSKRSEDVTDIEENSESSEQGTNINNNYRNWSRISNTENYNSNKQAEFRLLKIFGDNNSVAMGFFGGYSQNNYQRINESEEVRNTIQERFFEDTLISRRTGKDVFLDDSNQNENQEEFTLGVEYYQWKNGNDSKHRLYVQKNVYTISDNLKSLDKRNIVTEYTSMPVVRNQSQLSNQQNINEREVSPLQLRYDGYQNLQINWLGNDYWFINAKAIYSFGKADNENFYYWDREEIRDNETTSTEEIKRQNELLDIDDKLYLGRISTGYAISVSENDYTLFTGLNPFYEYSMIKSSGLDQFSQFYFDDITHITGILVPIYASFSITDNIGIWSGANLRGQIDNNIRKERKYPDPDAPNLIDYEFPAKNDFRQKRITTSQRLYLGFKYKHKSGLSVVTNLSGNISNVQNWFVSLRYSY